MSDALAGLIERVTFHNPENGFAVLRVQAKGHRDLVTVIGQLPRAIAGEYLEASGSWREDSEHGRQFQAQTLKTSPPNSLEGIEKFLGSGLVKGIGPHYAHRIVEVFGAKTLKVIDESPSFLREVKGIGPQRIQRIRESWRQQKAVRGIMIFLHGHGLGTARAVRIYKTYGEQAVEKVKEDPYRLAHDIWGIGFQTADGLAQRLGIDAHSPLRARAALRFALKELTSQGHCAYPQSGVLDKTGQLTGIPEDILTDAVQYLIDAHELIRADAPDDGGEPWLYLRYLYQAEIDTARRLRELAQAAHPLPGIDAEAALSWVEKKMGLTLAPTQRAALTQATTSKVLVITGGPGVGKTTLVRGILEIFRAKKLRCGLCAPTGRAAKRLAETAAQEAKTIHRLLEFDSGRGKPKHDRNQPLAVDLLVVDEMSMVDLPLMRHLVHAVPDNACLVLVGDINQLPSVGPGMVLHDIIASGVMPTVRLTEIFRQAQESGIVQGAHRVLHGELPASAAPDKLGDFYIVPAEEPAAILDRIVALVRDRIPARFGLDPVQDIQVLTPMNRSELGTRNLNQQLQEILNPMVDDGPEVQRFGTTFRVGDKVLQTVNNYDKGVFNGDIGRVRRIDLEEQEMTVEFDSPLPVGRGTGVRGGSAGITYDFEELDELALAYALTIHKSQGSEYPAVIIPLHTQHYLMLQRNLLYTGITRGKKLVVLVGADKALNLAVRRQDTSRRFTALGQRLSST